MAEESLLFEDGKEQVTDHDIVNLIARAEERTLAAEERAKGPAPRTPCSFGRVLSYVIPVILIGVGILALSASMKEDSPSVDGNDNNGGSTSSSLSNSDPTNFIEYEDPWEGLASDTVVKWSSQNNEGVEVVMLDALDSRWEDYFHLSVSEWEAGDPDALDLNTNKVSMDRTCEPVDGGFKFCNDNYGATKWRGITLVLVMDGFIVASTAKLNEHYLQDASYDERKYTLCHEMGHGFGLHNSEEMGNCMYYSDTVTGNVSPDSSNFQTLASMYGTHRRKKNRRRRGLGDENKIPDSIRSRLKAVISQLEGNRVVNDGNDNEGLKILHRSLLAESYSMDLGDGWSVEVHKLLE